MFVFQAIIIGNSGFLSLSERIWEINALPAPKQGFILKIGYQPINGTQSITMPNFTA